MDGNTLCSFMHYETIINVECFIRVFIKLHICNIVIYSYIR